MLCKIAVLVVAVFSFLGMDATRGSGTSTAAAGASGVGGGSADDADESAVIDQFLGTALRALGNLPAQLHNSTSGATGFGGWNRALDMAAALQTRHEGGSPVLADLTSLLPAEERPLHLPEENPYADYGDDGGMDYGRRDDDAQAPDSADQRRGASAEQKLNERIATARRFTERHVAQLAQDHQRLAERGGCDVPGCTSGHCVLCYCASFGSRLCAAHDRERHLASVCVRRVTLLRASSLARPVLHELFPTEYILDYATPVDAAGLPAGASAHDEAAPVRGVVFGGVAPSDIVDTPLFLPFSLPVSEGCAKCGSLHAEPIEMDLSSPRRVSSVRGGVYAAAPVVRVRCRGVLTDGTICGHERTVGDGDTAPLRTLGVTAHPTTSERLHEMVDDDVLSLYSKFLGSTQRGLSAADLCHVVGHGSDEKPSEEGLRRLLWCSRLFKAGPLALLQGQSFQCFACGPSPTVVVSDANFVPQFKPQGTDWQPNFVWPGGVRLPDSLVDACMSSVERAEGRGSGVAKSSCGDWEAAAQSGGGKSDALATTGGAYLVCRHRAVQSWFAIRTSEQYSIHLIMALSAASMGSSVFGLDISCQFHRWLLSRTASNPGWADGLLGHLLPGHTDLRISSGGTASPVVSLTCSPPPAPVVAAAPLADLSWWRTLARDFSFDAAAPSASVGSGVPSLSGTVSTALSALQGGLPASSTLSLAVPAVHSFAHKCSDLFGAYSVPGAGLLGEFAEQHFSDGGPTARASQAMNMSTGNSRMFHDANAREYNIKLTDTLPDSLLARLLTRWDSLRESVTAFNAALASVGPSVNTSEVALVDAHRRRAEVALAPVPQPPMPLAVSGLSTATLPLAVLQEQADALRAVVNAAMSAAGGAKEAAYVAELQQSPIAAAAMARRRITARDGGSKLARAVAVVAELDVELLSRDSVSSSPDAYVLTLFNTLHRKARALASARAALQPVARLDLRHHGRQATFSRALAEVNQLLVLLRHWQTQCTDRDVRRWPVPANASDVDVDQLPAAIGCMVFETGSTAFDHLLDVHLRLMRLREDIPMWVAEIHTACRNVEATLASLASALAAATAAYPDVESASGSSGLVQAEGVTGHGGMPVLFGVTLASAEAGGSSRYHVAAALASDLLRGFHRRCRLHVRLTRLSAGVSALPPLPSHRPTGHGTATTDGLLSAHATRALRGHGRAMLDGRVVARTWAELAGPVDAGLQLLAASAERFDDGSDVDDRSVASGAPAEEAYVASPATDDDNDA